MLSIARYSFTAELTGTSMERTVMPNLRNSSKAGFEPGLTRLRGWHSTTELHQCTRHTHARTPTRTHTHPHAHCVCVCVDACGCVRVSLVHADVPANYAGLGDTDTLLFLQQRSITQLNTFSTYAYIEVSIIQRFPLQLP